MGTLAQRGGAYPLVRYSFPSEFALMGHLLFFSPLFAVAHLQISPRKRHVFEKFIKIEFFFMANIRPHHRVRGIH